MKPLVSACLLFLFASSPAAFAQTRDEKVREDRRKVTEDGFWIYNDLDLAFERARETGKPILVVLRCIPCEECVKLDDELVDKDPVIRPLLEQFVCARQVSTNGLDLSLFQYDTDQSFAVFMLNAEGTIYGRFGTRSHRTEWYGDVSLPGLAKALRGALDLHADYPANRALLEGKRGGRPEVASPEQYPSLKDKFTDRLNYEGDVAKSCIHCHQIGDAQREYYWSQRLPIPTQVLFPYPHPKSIGLILDPKERATVQTLEEGSLAEASGLRVGDKITQFGGQPPLSFADVQWVLHQTDERGGTIPMMVDRDGNMMELSLRLPAGWRKSGDLSWRVTSWGLRRMIAGGMVLEAIDDSGREERSIGEGKMALRVKHVGRYGPHGAAKRAGIQPDDLLIAYDGRDDLMTETELFDYAINHHHHGDKVQLVVRRGDEELSMQLPIQP
jgi:hypothetical protein